MELRRRSWWVMLPLLAGFLWLLAGLGQAANGGDPGGPNPYGMPGWTVDTSNFDLQPSVDNDEDGNPDWGNLITGDFIWVILPEGLCFDQPPLATVSDDATFSISNGAVGVPSWEAELIDADNDGCYETARWVIFDSDNDVDTGNITISQVRVQIAPSFDASDNPYELKLEYGVREYYGYDDEIILHIFPQVGTDNSATQTHLTRGATSVEEVGIITIAEKSGYEFDYGDQFVITFPETINVNNCNGDDTAGVSCVVNEDGHTVTCTLETEDDNASDQVKVECSVTVPADYENNLIMVNISDPVADDDGDNDITTISAQDLIVATVDDPSLTVSGPDPLVQAPIGRQAQFTINITEDVYGSLAKGEQVLFDLPEGLSATVVGVAYNGGDCVLGCSANNGDVSCNVNWESTRDATACDVDITITANVAEDVEDGTQFSVMVSTTLSDGSIFEQEVLVVEAVVGATASVSDQGNADPTSPLMQYLGTVQVDEHVAGTLQAGQFFSIIIYGVSDAEVDMANASGVQNVTKYILPSSVLLQIELTNPVVDPTEVPIRGIVATDGLITVDVLDGDASGENGCGVTDAEGLILALTGCPMDTTFDHCNSETECGLGGFFWCVTDATTQCVADEAACCSLGAYEHCADQESCADAGGYWYDDACHAEPQCSPQNLAGCADQASCEAAGGYWCVDHCVADAAACCNEGVCSACTDEDSCQAQECHWWWNECHAEEFVPPIWNVTCQIDENGVAQFVVEVSDCGSLCGKDVLVQVAGTDPNDLAIDYSWLPGTGWAPVNEGFVFGSFAAVGPVDLLSGMDLSASSVSGWYAGVLIDVNGDGILSYDEDELKYCQFPVVGPSCGDYTDAFACVAHGCKWDDTNDRCVTEAEYCAQFTDAFACANAGCFWQDGEQGACVPQGT